MSIRLNVGGVEYATSKSTLVKVPVLASLITSNSDKASKLSHSIVEQHNNPVVSNMASQSRVKHNCSN